MEQKQLDLFDNPSPVQYSEKFPPSNCTRYVGVPPKKIEGVICGCWLCNDYGDFS